MASSCRAPEPRRHSYFGEEFGLKRNPEYAKTHQNGIGQSPSRYRGIEQAAGEKPFIDDMKRAGDAAWRAGVDRAPEGRDSGHRHIDCRESCRAW